MVRGTKLSGWKTEYPSTAPAYPTEMEHMLYFKNKKKEKKSKRNKTTATAIKQTNTYNKSPSHKADGTW